MEGLTSMEKQFPPKILVVRSFFFTLICLFLPRDSFLVLISLSLKLKQSLLEKTLLHKDILSCLLLLSVSNEWKLFAWISKLYSLSLFFLMKSTSNNNINNTEHCYCMKHEVVCAVQECKAPCEGCVPIPSDNDQCCPERYECREYLYSHVSSFIYQFYRQNKRKGEKTKVCFCKRDPFFTQMKIHAY